MRTTHIKGERKGERNQSSEHLRHVNNCCSAQFFHQSPPSSCYQFAIMGVVLLLGVLLLKAGSTTGVLMSPWYCGYPTTTPPPYCTTVYAYYYTEAPKCNSAPSYITKEPEYYTEAPQYYTTKVRNTTCLRMLPLLSTPRPLITTIPKRPSTTLQPTLPRDTTPTPRSITLRKRSRKRKRSRMKEERKGIRSVE